MFPDNPLLPLIPSKSHTWNGYPLCHASQFSKDFSGRLYFVLGQGLGDHVNGFRILNELQTRFPHAQFIVYADRRWEELVLRMGTIDIRWYPTALDPRSGAGTNDPYLEAHKTIWKEMSSHPRASYLAYDHFPMPDRHARGETTLEAISRTIGLDLQGKARPFLPLHEADESFVEQYLRQKGLEEKKFVLIAPFSWPNKRWSREKFSLLIDGLYKIHGFRSVLVSYPEMGAFENPGVVMAYDLTLGQIGGLLSRTALFVGLDSGPSHMAAAFEIPMVVIFVARKTIPFEVRALSPWALHIVEGFAKEEREPSPETVLAAVSFALKNRENLNMDIPDCPACQRPAHYVWGGNLSSIDFGCVCGLVIRKLSSNQFRTDSTSWEETGRASTVGLESSEGEFPLSSLVRTSDLTNLKKLNIFEERLRQRRLERIDLTFERRSEGESYPFWGKDSKEEGDIFWSQDALVYWMGSLGYDLEDVSLGDGLANCWTLRFVRRDIVPQGRKEKSIKIPWSEGVLTLADQMDYARWYTFENWGHPEDLVGIVKSQVALGYYKEAVRSSKVAFRANPSLRSLRWFGKAFYFGLTRSELM